MMKWEAEQKGYTCNDCYLSMQNCHDKSICCEDETGICDFFEELADLKENKTDNDLISRQQVIDALAEQMPTPYTPDGSHPADEGIFAAQEVYADCIETIKLLPPAQPYTAEEIQKMQELESAQVEKAYELGRKSVQSEITCNGCRYERFGNRVCYQCSRFYMDRYEVKQDE